jgi:RNA polymerase sigma-70 factor, ECF subfamily
MSLVMHTTPASLLERLRQPAAQADWERFVKLYTPLLFYWLRRQGVRPPDDADLVQEVFTVLIQKLPEFAYNRDRSFRGWLRTLTLNKWREKGRRRAVGVPVGAAALIEATVAEPADVVEEVEYRNHLVRRALQLMETDFQPRTWKACWEHVVSGKSAAVVAAELGMSEGAVYVAKCRVLSRLRQELQGLLD